MGHLIDFMSHSTDTFNRSQYLFLVSTLHPLNYVFGSRGIEYYNSKKNF